jgi:hypothetical protein
VSGGCAALAIWFRLFLAVNFESSINPERQLKFQFSSNFSGDCGPHDKMIYIVQEPLLRALQEVSNAAFQFLESATLTAKNALALSKQLGDFECQKRSSRRSSKSRHH